MRSCSNLKFVKYICKVSKSKSGKIENKYKKMDKS